MDHLKDKERVPATILTGCRLYGDSRARLVGLIARVFSFRILIWFRCIVSVSVQLFKKCEGNHYLSFGGIVLFWLIIQRSIIACLMNIIPQHYLHPTYEASYSDGSVGSAPGESGPSTT
uniref:Uncharacterized protein n=1 Tax=Helianthus annuus TaxID=4232 RepID=A0A251S9W1_HELAN